MKYTFLALIFCLASTQASVKFSASDRERDGFVGPVKRVVEERPPDSGENRPAGSRCRRMARVYDQRGRLVQSSTYAYCGSLELRTDYVYAQDGSRTSKGQAIQSEDLPPLPPPPSPLPTPPSTGANPKGDDGEPRTVFKYDASGKMIEEVSLTPGGRVVFKRTYSYDDKGRLTETAGYDDGRVSSRDVYSYSGGERLPSGFAYYRRDGRVDYRVAYTDYEFNPRGDWVKRKETVEDSYGLKTVVLVSRELEYYPDGK